MKKITLGPAEIIRIAGDRATIGDLFLSMEEILKAKGEIVCRYTLNGIPLSESDEKRYHSFAVSEIESLDVETQTPDGLFREVVYNWLESLPKLIAKTDKMALVLRQQGFDHQGSEFIEIIDSCHFLIESLMSLRSIAKDQEICRRESWSEGEILTGKAISEALSAVEKKDFVLLADVLEYDLGHCLQIWLETLGEVAKWIQKTGENSERRSTEKDTGISGG